MTIKADNPIEALDAVIGAMTPAPWEVEREELGVDFSDEEQEQAYPERIGPLTIEHDDSDAVEADARGVTTLRNVAPELLAVAKTGEALQRLLPHICGNSPHYGAALDAAKAHQEALDALRARIREVLR